MLKKKLVSTFGPGPVWTARAPGRVNIIGDHTDYTGGYVLPGAVDCEVSVAFRPTDDGRVEILSLDRNTRIAFDLANIAKGEKDWGRYAMGVAYGLQQEGLKLRGMRAVLQSTVPIGAGLSSSAALCVAVGKALCAAADVEVEGKKLAAICQRAEHEFAGTKCGIMDQCASILGKQGCVLFLDCMTMETELAPLDERAARIVVANTCVERHLSSSAYNERRASCEGAFHILQRHVPELKNFRGITLNMLSAYGHDLSDPMLKRARHVVTENARVLHAVRALKRGDFISMGALMDASHESLRTDFEVSCKELDIMVELAREVKGVFGSRMTGAGFGGCTVSLVAPDAVEEFQKHVASGYRNRTGLEPTLYVFKLSDGASVTKA